MNQEKLENQRQQEEDVTQQIPICEQRLRNGCKTSLDLTDGSDNDSDIIQQHSDVSRTNSQQQIQEPIDAVNKKLVELLNLTDDQKFLTEDQLKKLNEILESNSLDKQETIDFLIQHGIHINYQDYANEKKKKIYQCNRFIENYLIKPRNGISDLNENLGEINEMNNIIQYGINFKDSIDIDNFLISNKQVLLLKTENTLLSILNIYESLIIKNKKYFIQDSLFFKLNSYIQKRDKINLLYSAAHKMLCIRYPYNSNKERLSDVLEILNTLLGEKLDKKIIFIIPENKTEECDEIKRVFNNKCYKEVTDRKFTLNDLTEQSQQKLLEQEIILQGEKISLNKLIDKSDKNEKEIIDAEMLERLITNKVIKVGSRPLGTIGLEGAYSNLEEEVNMETFIDKLLSEESNDIYVISGIPSVVRENKLIEYLVSDIHISKRSKVNDLESQIAILNQDTTTVINNKIQIADDQFKIVDFKQICQNNRERKIYWINLKHERSVSKFMLQQIYNPDFHLKGNRFNTEVVIEKNVREQLVNPILSEIFIIGGISKEAVTTWLQFIDAAEQIQFQRNCNNDRIKVLNSQDNMLATFQEQVAQDPNQTIHLLKFEQDQLIWCNTHGSLINLSKYRGKNHRNTKSSLGADALITKIKDDKVVIIAADSGMGKTTALVKLYELQYALQSGAKESIMKSHWLITVNLKNYVDAIDLIDFNLSTDIVKNITDFLLEVDQSISDAFARRLLGMALVKENFGKPLLIALDGFDELSNKDDRDKIISLLKHLEDKTKAKCWITTSLHYAQTLEGTVSTFAIQLDPISDEIANEFIKKYLKNNLSLILSHEEFQSIFGSSDGIKENTRLQGYTKAFLIKMHEIFKDDKSKFIGTPLQLHLMLEDSTKSFKEWTQDISNQSPDFSHLGNDMWEVYANFFHRKYIIYLKKVKEQLRQEKDEETFHNYHNAPLKHFIAKSARKKSLEKFKDTEYIHPTFMDYFAAIFCLSSVGNLRECLLQKVSGNSNYQIIKIFLNVRLLNLKMTDIHLQEEYYEKILLEAAKENNMGIVRFVLNNFDNSSSIVDTKDNDGRTVLHTTVISGNLDMVKFLVNEKKADFNVEDNGGMTALHIAAASGNLDIVKYLISKGANVNAKDYYNLTVLQTAVRFGKFEIVKYLIGEGVEVDVRNNFEVTLLHMAAASGNLEMVKFLVNEKGANVNLNTSSGIKALHVAAFSGYLETVKFLVDEIGDDFMAKDDDGRSVLYMAAAGGNSDIVKFLVKEKNVNVDIKNNHNITVLHVAARFGNLDLIKFLVNEKKADLNAKDNIGRSVLHMAAASGSLDKIKFLVNEKMADFNAKDICGISVLYLAATSNNLEMVKLLTGKGADVDTKDNNDVTVLHAAARSGNLRIVKYLIGKGANVDAKNIHGITVLHMAAESGNLELVDFLINEKEFDFNVKDNNRNSVLHTAVSSGNLNMIKFLVIEKKSNVYTIDSWGTTILDSAASSGNLDMVKFLINERGVYFRPKDNHGRSVLHMAARSGNLKLVKFLINAKRFCFNDTDKSGLTVLHMAATSHNLDMVKFLIRKGNNVYAKNNFGVTVLHMAALSGNLSVVKFLVNEQKSDFNAKDDNNVTILHVAARSGNLGIVKFLINEKQVDFNVKDNNGVTILHDGARSGNLGIVKFLVNEKKADFNVKDNFGNTVLLKAIHSRNLEIVRFLIKEKKVDFNANDSDYVKLFEIPGLHTYTHIVEYLKTVAPQEKL